MATIRAAVDAGITFVDTGDFYGMGHNELLVGRALRDLDRDAVTLSVKFGALRGPSGEWGGTDTRPAAMRNFLAYSLTRLGTDHIDVYRPARLDPNVPIEDTIGAIAEQVEKGTVRRIGLSEVGSETIRRAQPCIPIADLQIEYSLLSRGIERDILQTCRELGIPITAYGVLSRGLIGGTVATDDPSDWRAHTSALPGREPRRTTSPSCSDCSRSPTARHLGRPARDRLGGRAGRGHHPGDRHEAPLADRRFAGRRAGAAFRRRPRRDRAAVPDGSAAGERYAVEQLAHLDSERVAIALVACKSDLAFIRVPGSVSRGRSDELSRVHLQYAGPDRRPRSARGVRAGKAPSKERTWHRAP